jgi:hypothetical protein
VKLNPEKTEVINVSKALQTHPKTYVLAKVVNKIIAFLSSVVSIGSAPISV